MTRNPVASLQKFYTVSEAAELLGRKPQTIRKHCQRGRINAGRVGRGGWLIPEAEIVRLAHVWEKRFARGRPVDKGA